MALVWQGPKSRSSMLSESLGQALGQGLGNFTGNYFANKKLNTILDDPQYKDKPLEEKWQALQQGLAPYGGFGEKALMTQLQIDQRREQRQQQQKELAARKILAKELGVPEDVAEGLPAEILIKAKQAMTPRAAPGGVTAQPIPPEIANKMALIKRQNPDVSASELKTLFDENGIPPIYSNTDVETRRREQELAQKTKETATGRDIQIHKLSNKVDEDISEKGKSADRQLEAVSTIRKSLQSGNVKPKSIANALRGFGVVGDKIADAFLNKDQAAFSASIPSLIEGMKDLFGVRLSDADLKIVQDKLPGLGKDPSANESILQVIEKYANLAKKRSEIAREVKKEHQGLRRIDFGDEVESRLEKWKLDQEGLVPMVSPYGKIVKVPKERVQEALNAGGKLANE